MCYIGLTTLKGKQSKSTHGSNHFLLRHMRQHKSKKYKRQVHNKKIQKTENYKIGSKRTLQQYTQKKRNR